MFDTFIENEKLAYDKRAFFCIYFTYLLFKILIY
jgi:hypothetical protein